MRTVLAPWSACAQEVPALGRSEAWDAGVGAHGEAAAVPMKDGESPTGTGFKNKNNKHRSHVFINEILML